MKRIAIKTTIGANGSQIRAVSARDAPEMSSTISVNINAVPKPGDDFFLFFINDFSFDNPASIKNVVTGIPQNIKKS